MIKIARIKAVGSTLFDRSWIGPCIAALFLAPAAVIVGLYPMSWLLGPVNFNVLSLVIEPYRIYLIVPLVIAVVYATQIRGWTIGLMVLSGVLLAVSAPSTIGAINNSDRDTASFYPEVFSSGDVIVRLDQLDAIASNSWFFRNIPPYITDTQAARGVAVTAQQAVDAFKDAQRIEGAKAEMVQNIANLQAQKDALSKQCQRHMRRHFVECGRIVTQQIPAIDNQLGVLTTEYNALSSATTPEQQYAVAVSATTSAKVELNVMERAILEKQAFVQTIPYLVAASFAFIALMITYGFRHWAFAVLVVTTAALSISSIWPISIDDRLMEFALVLYPVIFLLLCGFLVRFLVRAFTDNAPIPLLFGRDRTIRAAAWTALIWLPFPLLVGGIVHLNSWVYDQASDAIYCRSELLGPCGFEHPIRDSDLGRDTLRDDLNASIMKLLASLEAQGAKAAAGLSSSAPEEVERVKTLILGFYSSILPPNIYEVFPKLTPPSCSWYQIKCHIQRYALNELNRAYQRPRNQYLAKLTGALNDIGAQIVSGATNGTQAFQQAIKGQSEYYARYMTRSVDASFVGLNTLAILQMTYLLLVVIRAYLLGYGRVLYRGNAYDSKPSAPHPYMELTHLEAPPTATAMPKVKIFDESVEFTGDDHLPFLAKRSYDADDSEQATTLLSGHKVGWPIRRFANGCFFLRRVRRRANRPSITYSADGGRQFVVWTIPKEGIVYFNWRRFVAVSESCKLQKTISLRIGGLSTGTVMHASVRGPATLVLESKGEAEIVKLNGPRSVHANRVMGWVSGSKFQIASASELSAAYLDPSSLDPEAESLTVTEPSGGDGDGPRLGIIADFGRLLTP